MVDKRRKILISCSAARSLTQFRGKLIAELTKNHAVYVFTPTIPEESIRQFLADLGVVVYENSLVRNSISLTSDLKYIGELSKIIGKVKPDVFFAYTFKPLIFGSIVASLRGVKTTIAMLTGLGYNFADQKKSFSKTITQRLLKFSLNFNRNLKIIFHNEDDKQELISRNIITADADTYVVNGSGVDLSFYEYSEPEVEPIRFLLISRFIKAKGVEEYFEAIKIMHSKYPEVKFSVVGTYIPDQIDSINADLHQEITLSDFVDYTGWVNDVRPFIKAASVVVLPSYREGTPRSILEAMAMGRATITTHTAGCRQTINQQPGLENGLLIEVKSVTAIVEAMEYYTENPQDIIRYGINGRRYAEEKYDVEKVNADMLKILIPLQSNS